MQPCDVCPNPARVRGLCEMHYNRWRRHGDPTVTLKPVSKTPAEAFKHYMPEQPPAVGCWLWRGTIADTGYGTLSVARKRYGAHRVSYELYVGPIPDGLHIRHQCVGTRSCVNPAHLLVGTPAQNAGDTVEQGRTAAGERNGMVKLSDAQVVRLRAEYAKGGITQRALADKYGIRQSQVSRLTAGKRRRLG